MKLALGLIREDGGTQSRAELVQEKIREYAEKLDELPPVIVFYDGNSYWLADGFHRVAAAEEARLGEISADVRQGTQRDAVLFSFSANAAHGIPRSAADKRRAVERMLADEEWASWSDRKIAETCRVGEVFVAGIRRELRPPPTDTGTEPVFRLGRDGRRYNVTNIGRKKPTATASLSDSQRAPTPPSPTMSSQHSQPPPPSSVPPSVDPVHAEAARLETRLVALTDDVCAASLRVQRLISSELERSLSRLTRIARGSAA